MKQQKLIIIVPVFNEALSLRVAVDRIRSSLPSLERLGFDTEIYLIDDGSEDESLKIAKGLSVDRVLVHNINRGVGAAVRTGLNVARDNSADIVVKIDADLQHDPAEIGALVGPILKNQADIVYGYRFNRIGYKMPLIRNLGNKAFAGLVRWLTGYPVKDSAPGMIALSKKYLDRFNLPGDYNYGQQILIDAYHKDLRFAHVDISFEERKTGESHITLRYPLKVLPQLVMVLIGVRPMKVFLPIGIFFTGIALAVAGFQLADWIFGDATKPITNANLVLGTSFLGIQSLFFGMLAELVVSLKKH
jgi:glycosyltransferase involved in cell wall biosynthesis